MNLNESTGLYNVRKTLRFAMEPVGNTADYLMEMLKGDEERAAGLSTVHAVIDAEHRMFVRRVFDRLPDPLPSTREIREAFKRDPESETMTGRNANNVLQLAIDRCRYNRWAVPPVLNLFKGWQPLFIKKHWQLLELWRHGTASGFSFAGEWAGKSKAEVRATNALLRPPKKRKPSRDRWYDHGMFRLMFDNHSCGMSWLKEDFVFSRTFILRDGDRFLIGIVPRSSAFCPYTIPDASPDEMSYLLYEEVAGYKPILRRIPRAQIDLPARRGFVLLFELTGRGLRNKTNLNAIILRALLSDSGEAEPGLHLDKIAEFYARGSSEIPSAGNGRFFRQRFNEDKFFVTLHVTCNPQMVTTRVRPQPWGDLPNFIGNFPTARFINVKPAQGGYVIESEECSVKSEESSLFISSRDARSGKLAGTLAKLVVENDCYVLFAPSVPDCIRRAVKDKFDYIIVRGRDPFDAGGVRRGYQLVDRLFVGDIEAARQKLKEKGAALARKREIAAAVEQEHAARAAEKQRRRDYNAEQERVAKERRAAAEKMNANYDFSVFETPAFQSGKYRFKFCFKTSDNVRREGTCRGDCKDEVFQKLRTLRIRPIFVEALENTEPLSAADRLKRLDELKQMGVLSDAEYTAQRAKIISEL